MFGREKVVEEQPVARPPPAALGWPVPPETGLRELLQTDLGKEITRDYFAITTDKEYALAQLETWQEESIRRKGELGDMELLFSLPHPRSRFACNMRGQPRHSLDTVRYLPFMDTWRMAHVSRGRGGFERKIQRSQFSLQRYESADSNAGQGRPVSKPPLAARIASAVGKI